MTDQQLRSFLDDPVRFLSPSAEHPTGIQVRIPDFQAGRLIEESVIAQIELQRFATDVVPWKLSLWNHFLTMTPASSEDDANVLAHALSWSPERATWMVLSSTAEFFVTSALTGCAIAVGGSRQEPRTVHANRRFGCSLVGAGLERAGFFGADGGVPMAVFDDVAIDEMMARHHLQGVAGPRVFGVRDASTDAWRMYRHIAVTDLSNMSVTHTRTEVLWR